MIARPRPRVYSEGVRELTTCHSCNRYIAPDFAFCPYCGAERVRHARLEIDRLVAQIRAVDPDVRRIVLFGSLAKNSVKRPSFDIDLAVDSDHYTRLIDIALDSEFKVDLVDLACCSRYVAAAVEQHGVEL